MSLSQLCKFLSFRRNIKQIKKTQNNTPHNHIPHTHHNHNYIPHNHTHHNRTHHTHNHIPHTHHNHNINIKCSQTSTVINSFGDNFILHNPPILYSWSIKHLDKCDNS